MMTLAGKKIVLGVSGGIAAYKTPELVRRLGIIETNEMARPQRALNEAEAATIETILRQTGLLG